MLLFAFFAHFVLLALKQEGVSLLLLVFLLCVLVAKLQLKHGVILLLSNAGLVLIESLKYLFELKVVTCFSKQVFHFDVLIFEFDLLRLLRHNFERLLHLLCFA